MMFISKKSIFLLFLTALLILNSLWFIHFFKVQSYLPDSHYLSVINWIKKHVPENRRDKLFFVNDYNSNDDAKNKVGHYQLSTIQLFAGIGDPEPPFFYTMLYSDDFLNEVGYDRLNKIRKKFPVSQFLQKHDQSLYFKIYGTYLGSIKYENIQRTKSDLFLREYGSYKGDIYPCAVPLLYSMENFHEILLAMCAYPSHDLRPRTLEYRGFPLYADDITNVDRNEINGHFYLNGKIVRPKLERVEYKAEGFLVYRADFLEPVHISKLHFIFDKKNNNLSKVFAQIEYRTKNSGWYRIGTEHIELNIDNRGVGSIKVNQKAYNLSEHYKKLFIARDDLTSVGLLQFEKRHTMSNFYSYLIPDELKGIKELKIILFNEKHESINLIKTELSSFDGYENDGIYLSAPIDVRPFKYSITSPPLLKAVLDAEMPVQTDAQLMFRFSSDAVRWSQWHNMLSEGRTENVFLYGKNFNFLQYKIILLSRNGQSTPAAKGLKLSFHNMQNNELF